MATEYRSPQNQAELEDSFQCSAQAFGGGKWALPFFTKSVKFDPWFDMKNTRVCYRNGKAVSVVQIFDRPMRVGDCILRVGGVGSVGTDPAYRRQGYSLNVLKDSVRYMRTAGYDISILYTGQNVHYMKAGWVIYPGYRVRIDVSEISETTRAGTVIEPCNLERDLPTLMEIYDQFNSIRTGTIVRSKIYWGNRPQWRDYPEFFLMAKRNKKAVAYLQADRWNLLEFGCLPDEHRALVGLFSRFFSQAKAEGVEEATVEPCPLEMVRMFQSLGYIVRKQEMHITMVRLINLESLLNKMIPLLTRRLKASSFHRWEGTVRFRYEADEQAIIIKNSEIKSTDTIVSPDIDFVGNQEQLLRSIFGTMKVEDIAFSNCLSLTDGHISLLNVLFPQDELFTWRTDTF